MIRVNRQVFKLALLATFMGGLLGAGALYPGPWQVIELYAFDLMSIATAPRKSALPITIVGIDEGSFAQLGLRWPWPRDMHARLVDRLVKAGAAVIAFDVLYPEAGPPAEDAAFARSIADAGNVVLAADHAYHETIGTRQWLRVDPLPSLTAAGAVTGLATMSLDGDTVARRVAGADDAFWRVVVRTMVRVRPGTIAEPFVAQGALMRHLGPARTFPYVSYYQVLNGDPAIPADYFADQIVLVGRDVRASPESGTAHADTFATPFLRSSGLLTPGVEIHATQIENALMGQTIHPAPAAVNLLFMTSALLLLCPFLVYWSPWRSALGVLGIAGLAGGSSLWLFGNANLWLATGAAILALTLAFLTTGLGAFAIERRRAGEIRSAFAKYVSSAVVEEMIAHPDRLKLGGQRREITVLFSDLAGFTAMSEKLSPEAVGQVINLYLTEMTRIVMDSGGTVDKFIGDAVMAFWGAPLDDPEHALHGVSAAVAMQEAMLAMQDRFAAFGVGRLEVRIGLHSGIATVGNMGSDLRFDYTALGDTVNLASRLEGVNKAYGTGILVSAASARQVGARILMRRVDRVRVKGKEVPVDVLTPCADAVIVKATEDAWQAYLRRDWDAALAFWATVRARSPDDQLLAVYTQRIAEFSRVAPPPQWDGSVALEKL